MSQKRSQTQRRGSRRGSKNHPQRGPRSKTFTQGLVSGRIDVHPDGFAFVIADDPEHPNIYIPAESLADVMNRDQVLVQVESSFEGNTRLRGQVHSVTRRAQKDFFGWLRSYAGGAIVVPSDERNRRHSFKVKADSPVDPSMLKNGVMVLAEITEYPTKDRGECQIVQIAEDVESASQDTLRILVENGWPRDFPPAVDDNAREVSHQWLNHLRGPRVDMSAENFVTIDGFDAKDFDDAVMAKFENGRMKLWVAIADVSHFVRPGSELDNEAFLRSTSVYLPDHVVPMLPELLSNGLCSLVPHEQRAALVCEMTLNENAKPERFRFFQALIKSKKRMTYDLLQDFIENKDHALEECEGIKESLNNLIEVYKRLRKAKTHRGAIDMDIPEPKLTLSPDGHVLDIQSRARLDAHRLIEECMLAANNCTAQFLKEKFKLAVYRVHEIPDERKIADLIKFISQSAMIDSSRLAKKSFQTASDFSELIAEVKKRGDEGSTNLQVLSTLVLRSMKQARYAAEPLGHFALALKDYTHFTSPIRRYPDLMVHRLIKEAVGIEKSGMEVGSLEEKNQHCSDKERLAVDIERKVIDIKKCRFMEDKLGEDYGATVTGVTEKGLFCQIELFFVDGFLSADTLYDRAKLSFVPERMCFESRSGQALHMGDKVKIKVAAVNVATQRIEFDWIVDP